MIEASKLVELNIIYNISTSTSFRCHEENNRFQCLVSSASIRVIQQSPCFSQFEIIYLNLYSINIKMLHNS